MIRSEAWVHSLFLVTLFTLGGPMASAHPVSFKGATTLMSSMSTHQSEVQLIRSMSHRWALGATYLQENGSAFGFGRVNVLVQRWNETDSQGNIYLGLGAGQETRNYQVGRAALADLILDWESRKYYVDLENRWIQREQRINPALGEDLLREHKLRLGFAPFLADYRDLNIWTIAQFDTRNDVAATNTTLLLRFYYRNVLWEMGAGFDGSTLFNLMVHL